MLVKQKFYFFCLLIISFFGVIFLLPKVSQAANTNDPEVKIFDQGVQSSSFFGFPKAFKGGVRVAVADVDGDSVDEIIIGAGSGGGPNVQVYESNGSKIKSFMAYDTSFRNGIMVSACDLTGDGKAEIITSPGPMGGPNVKVFNLNGERLKSFMAYGEDFRGGVNVACGDVIGDGKSEIITGPGPGSGPQVRVFNQKGESLSLDIWPFEKGHRGGVSVASGKFISNEKDLIVTAIHKSSTPRVKVFNNQKSQLSEFLAYSQDFIGGVNIAAGDIDNDGLDEIITAANAGAGPHVRTFEYQGQVKPINFFPYPKDFRGGVFVASGDVLGNGFDEIITGPGFLANAKYPQYHKYIEIDISDQTLEIVENGVSFGKFKISSGKSGMDTPTGIYRIMSKSLNAYSSRYTLYMPWWMQFTGMGHGIHGLPYWKLRGGGVLKEGVNHLGIRVSHGCVRLSWEAAEKVFNFSPVGTVLIIHN